MKTSKYSNLKTLAGSAGLTAASIGAADAAVVQITLTGNTINSAGNSLNLDVTGDSNPDLEFMDGTEGYSFGSAGVRATFVGYGFAAASFYVSSFYALAFGESSSSSAPQSLNTLVPFTFTDALINGGALTNAFLDVTASNISETSHEITLNRVIFDDANTAAPAEPFAAMETEFSPVPEPSSLVLLAMGAGGLAARRRRRAA